MSSVLVIFRFKDSLEYPIGPHLGDTPRAKARGEPAVSRWSRCFAARAVRTAAVAMPPRATHRAASLESPMCGPCRPCPASSSFPSFCNSRIMGDLKAAAIALYNYSARRPSVPQHDATFLHHNLNLRHFPLKSTSSRRGLVLVECIPLLSGIILRCRSAKHCSGATRHVRNGSGVRVPKFVTDEGVNT